MNLRIGSQPSIAATTSVEAQTKPSIAAETKQEAAPLTAANTSIRAESQLSAVALYSQLNNQLQPVKRFEEKTVGKQDAKIFAYLPKTLFTGDGDDKVEINMEYPYQFWKQA